MPNSTQAQKIQAFLLKQVPKHPQNITTVTAQKFGVTRTTVRRHLEHLIKANKIIKSGTTKQTTYALTEAHAQSLTINLSEPLDEFNFFHQNLKGLLKKHVNENTYQTCEYVITEMLNNCKDHSSGKKVKIDVSMDKDNLNLSITDDGIGAFKTLFEVVASSDPRIVIFELSKGKLTRDPSNHTGEGIFFTSRAVDTFSLCANGYCFFRDNFEHDWSFHSSNINKGTQIKFKINRQSSRKLTDIFLRYQNENLSFAKTEIIVALSQQYGERLISRSQAKRVVNHLDKFTHITLDFSHVQAIGQGFVDQLFRVYKNTRPEITIDYINANDDVAFMIERGKKYTA